MKLTEKDIGKKFRRPHWTEGSWFLLTGLSPTGKYVVGSRKIPGIAEFDDSAPNYQLKHSDKNLSDWLPVAEEGF